MRANQEFKIEDPSYRVKHDDEIIVTLPPLKDVAITPENIPLDILYEDDALIVINKPAGMVVHPAPGHSGGTLVNALMAHCGKSLSGIGGERRPGIVHRLDKDTSGVMVACKHDKAHHYIAEQFASHGKDGRLQRRYQCFVWSSPVPAAGRIEASLARHSQHRTKIQVSQSPQARFAATQYKVLQKWGTPSIISLLECTLETGRTHQIRVHMAHLGHPVVGDRLYGSSQLTRVNTLPATVKTSAENLNRQALHAAHLGFEHPDTKIQMSFDAPLPEDMADLKRALEKHL